MTLVRTEAIADPGDLIGFLPEPDGVAWVRHGEGLVGWGEAARFAIPAGRERFVEGAAAFRAWCDAADVDDPLRVPGTGPVAFAAFAFDPDAAGSVVIVPRVVLGRRDGHAWMTVTTDSAHPPAGAPALTPQALPGTGRIRYAGGALHEVGWLEAVARAVKAIDAGELDKVVLARDVAVWSESALDPRVLARRLADRYDDCFTFACDGLVGATPELLVRRTGATVESLVLAGSAPRGAQPAEDDDLGRGLQASEKDRWEHELAVESVRPVLAGHCDDLTVDGPRLLRLANVQHLATALRGTLRASPDVLALVQALHPSAAVCGTPTPAALDRIRELEGLDRARYAGPVGWTDARGDGEFGIALRCAEVDGSRARLFAGAGIVSGSLPEAELEETRLKLRAMQSALERP